MIALHVCNGPNLNLLDRREPFRGRSPIAPVCVGVISGSRAMSYRLGLDTLAPILTERAARKN